MFLVAVVASAALAPSIALAQQKVQIETQLFKPSPFVGDYFTVGTGDVMGECRWNIGLMLNYQNDPLVLATNSGDHLGSLVGHQTTANVLGAIKLLDWLALGFDVPVVVHQVGDKISTVPTAGSGGMGDIRLVPRARLYKSAGGLFSLAAEAGVSLPTGKQFDAYMGRNGYSIFPRLLGSFDFGWSGLALNAGALFVSSQDKAFNVATGNAIDTRLGGWVGVVPKEVDLIAEVNSQMKLGEPLANAEETPMEFIGGMRWKAIPGLFVTGGAGAGVTAGAGGPDFRAFVGVQYASCCQKKATPPPPPPPPPPPKPVCDADPDGDKVCSACVFDQKREAEFASVCKGADKCPAEAEDLDGNEDSDGCPDPDNEPDGICDPWVEEQGLAGKYKGVCVGSDKCPAQPETVNSYQDEDGCQDQAVVIEDKKIIILQKVEFHFNEARIKDESFPLLDEVVKTLKENPQIQKISIEGHSDERGEARYNQKLSAGRVQTVLNYLVEHGVEAKRLTSKGFGEARPLIKGATTEEDHQKNRRVEFIILETK
jgi:outer membrane protein OmpA-like peptidoglycan-associated protein